MYMRFEKHAFNACYENMHFTILENLMLSYYITGITLYKSFSRNVRLMHVLVNVCFNKRLFYMRYLTDVKRAFMNVRLTCVLKNACFTMLQIWLCRTYHFPI